MTMKQQTLAMAADQSGYEQYRKPTRREEFLKIMDAIVPWSALCEVIARNLTATTMSDLQLTACPRCSKSNTSYFGHSTGNQRDPK